MGAVLVDEPDAPLASPEGDQLPAQHPHLHLRAIRPGHLLAHTSWDPVATHQLAHRRAPPRPRDQLILHYAQHPLAPPTVHSCCHSTASARPGCTAGRFSVRFGHTTNEE